MGGLPADALVGEGIRNARRKHRQGHHVPQLGDCTQTLEAVSGCPIADRRELLVWVGYCLPIVLG